jgi:hypothetical protein
MECCTICDTPLEEGSISSISSAVGGLAWITDAGGDGQERLLRRVLLPDASRTIMRVSASRCPRCQVGVFSYEEA